MNILKKNEPFQDYPPSFVAWNIFISLNLLLSVVIIVDLFLDEYYVPATVSHINESTMIANYEGHNNWSTIKSPPKISDKFKFGDSIIVKSTPIFDFYKSYSYKFEPHKEYSNIGFHTLFPIFVIMINVVLFIIFIILFPFLDFRNMRFDSVYYSFFSPYSIADTSAFFLVLPMLLNLFYWYKLWSYFFT